MGSLAEINGRKDSSELLTGFEKMRTMTHNHQIVHINEQINWFLLFTADE